MAQRKARTVDRDRAVEIINDAYADGQLTADEHDERVTKVLAARTLAQLDRHTLDLQRVVPPVAEPPPPRRPGFGEQLKHNAAQQRAEWKDVPRWQKRLIAVIGAVCVGGITVGLVIGPDEQQSSADEQTVLTVTEKGLADFVQTYEEEFGTTEVVQASLSTDNVAVSVPTTDGRARHVKWTYRDDEFTKVAAARVNQDGQGPIDLEDVDLERLMQNIAVARRTLDVEDPDSVLVWVEREYVKKRPSVRIQISNTYGELGMYTTDLSGREVLHTSPFREPDAP